MCNHNTVEEFVYYYGHGVNPFAERDDAGSERAAEESLVAPDG